MSQPVDDIRISRFQQDRRLLPYNDAQVAVLMGISKTSYSSYVNGRYPITNAFLQKFYAAFDEELQLLRKHNTLEEKVQDYKSPEYEERVKALENKYDKLMESHQLIAMEIYRLEKNLGELLDNKFKTLLTELKTRK